jgi:hypothetical protein
MWYSYQVDAIEMISEYLALIEAALGEMSKYIVPELAEFAVGCLYPSTFMMNGI